MNGHTSSVGSCQDTLWRGQPMPRIFGDFLLSVLPPSWPPTLLSLQIICEKSCSQAYPRGNGKEKQCLFSSLSSYTVSNNANQPGSKQYFASIYTSVILLSLMCYLQPNF